MKMIQLYAHQKDLYTPFDLSNGFSITKQSEIDEYERGKQSIATHGILMQLHVDTSGTVFNGHGRLNIARQLGITYLPIDAQYFWGLQYNNPPYCNPAYLQISQPLYQMIANVAYSQQKYIGDCGTYACPGDKGCAKHSWMKQLCL